jgi:DNA-binding CsgD family transcriptional regulator
MAVALRQVLEAAEAAGDRFAALQAIGVLGQIEFQLGDFAEAEVKLQQAVEIAREEDKVYRLTWSLWVLGFSRGWEGRIAEGLAAFEEAKAVYPAWRDSNVLELESTVHFLAGDCRQVLECVNEAQARNPGGMSRRRSAGLIFAALAAAEIGLEVEARRYAAAARAVFGERDWSISTPMCTYAEAVIAAQGSGPHEALPGLSEAAAGLLRMEVLPFAAPVLVDLAEAAATAGEATIAKKAADQLVSIARHIDRPLYHGLAALGAAWAATAGDTRQEAASAARRALDALAGTGARGFCGRALDVLGRSIDRSDRAGAINAYQEAAGVFEACGARWRRERTVEALRSLRGRGQKAAAALLGPASLTRREREVARLATAGLTAKEIAKPLILGQRTVEGHLANIYAKLGVRSKVELARRAGELDL